MGHKRWKDYLNEMDHSKGTSNVMIQKAMKMEISELKRVVRTQATRIEYLKDAAQKWRNAATRYQQKLGSGK